DLDGAAAGIDLDLADVRRVWVRGLHRVVSHRDVEAVAAVLLGVQARELGQRQAGGLAVDGDLGAPDGEPVRRLVQPPGGRVDDLLAQLFGRPVRRGGGRHRAAALEGAGSAGDDAGVGLL